MKTKIQAHRGASAYCPENTLEAFALAIEQKADGIELDVHLSKDGQIVVAHDLQLERVSNGKGLICDYTLSELKSFSFNKLFPDQKPCRIPALAEVYDLIKTSNLILNIELKTTESLYPGMAEKLVKLTHDFAMDDRVIYSSFNHYSLVELQRYNPAAKTGLLYNIGLVDPWVYAGYVKAWAIHPHYYIIASLPETVQKCHEKGIVVNVWTADEPDAIKLMLKCGVDAIITNKPDVALNCRSSFVA